MKKFLIILILILSLVIIETLMYIKLSFESSIPILAYHDVIENPINETDVSIANFEKQMKYLYKHNYKTLSLDEFYNWKKGKKIEGKKVVLTFDDGKESFYKTVVPILKKYNFKAAVFVIGTAINADNYLTYNQIQDLKDNYKNISVEAHSYNLHMGNFVTSDNYDIYNSDMQIEKECKYKYYAYPFGIKNDNYIKALKDNGYKMAFMYSPSKWTNKRQNNYEITRVPIYKNNSLLKFIIKVNIKI